MNFDWMDIATVIGATGALIVSRNHRIRRFGFLFDLIACFAWGYYTWKYVKTPGAILVQVLYVGAAVNGIREHFFKRKA